MKSDLNATECMISSYMTILWMIPKFKFCFILHNNFVEFVQLRVHMLSFRAQIWILKQTKRGSENRSSLNNRYMSCLVDGIVVFGRSKFLLIPCYPCFTHKQCPLVLVSSGGDWESTSDLGCFCDHRLLVTLHCFCDWWHYSRDISIISWEGA